MDPISRLAAIEDIRQLKARYFRLMDERDWAGMAEVFARDALFEARDCMRVTPIGGKPSGPDGPVVRGRAAIMEFVREVLAEVASVHHGHGHEVELLGPAEARGVIAMEDWLYAADRTTLIVHGAGHYAERYVVEDGAWRIAEIRLTRLVYGVVDGV